MMSGLYDQRRQPLFLQNVAPEAEVHSGFLDILDSFQRRDDGTEVLADTVKELTGTILLLTVHATYYVGFVLQSTIYSLRKICALIW